MSNILLVDILSTQDYSREHAEKICDQVLNNSFNIQKDPISGIIIEAFVNNDYSDFEGMEQDLSYAIGMLTKARDVIKTTNSIDQP
jgi:hypothetical protein